MEYMQQMRRVCLKMTQAIVMVAAIANICLYFQNWVVVKNAGAYNVLSLLFNLHELKRFFASDDNLDQAVVLSMLLIVCLLCIFLHCCSIVAVLRDVSFLSYGWGVYAVSLMLPTITILLLYKFSLEACVSGHEIYIEITVTPYFSLVLNMCMLVFCVIWLYKGYFRKI